VTALERSPVSGSGGPCGRVVVVGAINVDFVVAAPRLPGPGETVVGAGLERHGGGKGANAAVAATRAGAEVRLVGAVGRDETGAAALQDLRRQGVSVEGVAELESEATGVALIVVDPNGENQIAVGAGANASVGAEQVRSALADSLSVGDCVLVSTEIPDEAVVAAVEVASSAGVDCILNPAPVIQAVPRLLELGPMLTPNATEIEDLAVLESWPEAGDEADAAVVAAHAERIATRTGAAVVVTLGGDGVLLIDAGGAADRIPARPAQVVDTTGAGDTFNGVLAARLAAGDGLRDAARVATVAASLSVAHVGARGGMPDAGEIEAALRED